MSNEKDFAEGILKTSVSYMVLSAAIGVIIGLIMLFYPGGTMALMEAAFIIFQLLLTIFIGYYALTEALYYFKTDRILGGVLYALIGILAIIFIWVFNVSLVYFIIAFFLVLTGISDIVGGTKLPGGRHFLIFLGIVNILIAVIILMNPLVLPLLIAWYVLFWGISRLFLSFELKRLLK
jgi:uncharacterized membrane protein HdeD (DUF308 family)